MMGRFFRFVGVRRRRAQSFSEIGSLAGKTRAQSQHRLRPHDQLYRILPEDKVKLKGNRQL